MIDKRFARAMVAVEWLLLAIFTGLLAVHTLPHAWRTLNTDFPNYYLAAQLAHEGYDMSQAYDWRWLQREKDHRKIDQPVVGLAPITPFSTLFLWPLVSLPPLEAKHIWLLLQLMLLVPSLLLIGELTGQPLRRVTLLTIACLPMHRNLLYGQFYILLLAMIVAACWAYQRRLSALAGSLVGLAAMTKVFPIVFALYFLRKEDWRALLAVVATVIAACLISIAIFGWSMNREYLEVILPWTLRGEVLPAYTLAGSSLAALLHRLFIYEPQWNPHPWHNAPAVTAVLGPVMQVMLLGPVFLLIRGGRSGISESRRAIALEWSVLLCATLATSTSPASYNFVLLIFPMVVFCAFLMGRKPVFMLVALLLYFGIGYPGWNTASADGLLAILHVPRLFLLLAFVALGCWVLAGEPRRSRLLQKENIAWGIGLAAVTLFGIFSGLRRQNGLYDDYAYRLPMPEDAYLAADPLSRGGIVRAVAMLPNGYRVIPSLPTKSREASVSEHRPDQLSFAEGDAGNWIEEVTDRSRILVHNEVESLGIEGRSPVLSADGKQMGYIDERQGVGRLMMQTASGAAGKAVAATPEWMNVHEATVMNDGLFYAAATGEGIPSQIYLVRQAGGVAAAGLGEARYPSVSPDRHWLAYSRFQAGAWNLWLLDRTTKQTRRLSDVPCNQVESSWEADSKTLMYASDCGRSLGFTAICRRKVVP